MIDKALKKKLKNINIEDQSELVSLLIGVVSTRIGIATAEIVRSLENQIPELSLQFKVFDQEVIDSLSSFDLSVFVSEADNYLHDHKRTETGSYYTPIKWVMYMTRISVSNWIADLLNIDYDDAQEFLLMMTDESPDKSIINKLEKQQVSKLIHALESIQIIDIACGAGAFLIDTVDVLSKLYSNAKMRLKQKISIKDAARYFCKEAVTGIDLHAEPLAVYTLCLMWKYADQSNWELSPKTICSNSLQDDLFSQTEPMQSVLRSGGYDIVIGNPPYLGEKGNTDVFRTIRKTKFGQLYYEGKMDLSYFFTIRAVEILKPNGILTYLTTNYFITADGAVKYRKYIRANSKFLHILNMNTYPVFKDALGQHNIIYALKKELRNDHEVHSNISMTHVSYIMNEAHQNKVELEPLDILNAVTDTEYVNRYVCQESDLYREDGCITVLSDVTHKKVLDMYESFCDIKLKNVFNINQGIVSGADQVSAAMLRTKLSQKDIDEYQMEKGDPIFVFSSDDACLNKLEEKPMRPFYKNSDIATYIIKPRTSRVIVYFEDANNEMDIEYPCLMEHLNKYRSVLEARREVKTGTRPWYCLQWPRKSSVFEGPKIVVPQRSKVNRFAFTEDPFYSSADVYYFKDKHDVLTNEEWLYYLGLLNSAVIYLWLYHYGKRKGELLELYSKPLLEIVVPEFISESWQVELSKTVQTMMECSELGNTGQMEQLQMSIDRIILEAMGLDNESFKTVLDFRNRYRRN